ncbi:MAG: hypothetical protein HY581_01610 [Nitrospirae bacterium]|nr:hypothetical protein [Nitrospirota bacterium]
MAEVTNWQETSRQQEEGQEPKMIRSEGGCCLPVFAECGPNTCGLPLAAEGEQEPVRSQPMLRNKVVKLTPAGAQRLFNGEDDEIYSREDLMEMQPDGGLKVTGSCTGTVWLVQKDEIAAIIDA